MSGKKLRRTEMKEVPRLSGAALVLAERGTLLNSAVHRLEKTLSNSSLFFPGRGLFQELGDALNGNWDDTQSAEIIDAVSDFVKSHRSFDVAALCRWIRCHPGDPKAVIDCLKVDPPEEISIMQLLSRAGSQKVVFLANWRIAQREVVLKQFKGAGGADRLIDRELQPHPLSMAHPNIIETHLLKNKNGERFLVERRLPVVLSDSWPSHGIQEAANLLRDIASALAFLEDKQLVHGDIKPDNIGFEEGNYILLDFGICRPSEAFTQEVTPTGSLRTRAPEVLLGEKPHSRSSDVWALGATVYNAVVGRFPLFQKGEAPPRVSHPAERSNFEQRLTQRVEKEWNSWIDMSLVPEPLRDVLAHALEREPASRMSAAELVRLAENELAAFLRIQEEQGRFSPREELEQLVAYLPSRDILTLMPDTQKHELRQRLDALHNAKGLTIDQKGQIAELKALVA